MAGTTPSAPERAHGTPPGPDGDGGAPDAPVGVAQLSAPQLLTAVLGDYWFGGTDPVPSAALVALLAEFGVSGESARAALSRLTRQHVLETERSGRRTYHRLSPSAVDTVLRYARLLFAFGAEPVAWDGWWTCVAFAVPDGQARARPALRAGLRRAGFAPLYDGVWVSPRDRADRVGELLDELGVATATVLRARSVSGPPGARRVDPVQAWDLDELRAGYEQLARFLEALAGRVATGGVSDAEAFVTRTTVKAWWRELALGDPRLPTALLPDDWPLPRTRRWFVEVYDALAPAAERRARAVVAPFGLAPEVLPRAHTVDGRPLSG